MDSRHFIPHAWGLTLSLLAGATRSWPELFATLIFWAAFTLADMRHNWLESKPETRALYNTRSVYCQD